MRAPIHALLLATALVLAAGPALAYPVELLASPMDDDGQITLGELFDDAGAASGVVAGRRSGGSVVLDAAQVQALARRNGLEWANTSGVRRIIVRGGAVAPSSTTGAATFTPASATTPSAPAARGATVEVLTYARSLAAGETINPEDVVWTTMQAHQAPADGPDDAALVAGLSARRALRAGAPVRAADLTRPQVIARGELIDVVYEAGGVSLTLRARAMENATQGEAFRVQNVESGRIIQVVASEPGRALAGPAARAARS